MDSFPGLRVIVGLPPESSFAGQAYELGVVCIETLQRLDVSVMAITAEEWEDLNLRAGTIARAKDFDPNFALAIPQAGYGLRFKGVENENFFTDVLGIPLALPWDHLLTQAPTYFINHMYTASQQPGALSEIRRGLAHPLNRHYCPDSGHVEVYEQLGLLRPGVAKTYVPSGVREFIAAGLRKANPTVRGRVAFAGNIYTAQGAKLKLLEHELMRQIDSALLEAKRQNWRAAGWFLLRDILEQIPLDFRERNGLTPDHPLFWWLALDLLSFRVNTDFRLCVLESIDAPVDFYGNFVDPESSLSACRSDRVSFCGSVPYRSMPELFRQYEVWVDVTNAPFIRGCGAKVYHCFVAGSFMLIDYKEDVRAEIGELAERFMYHDSQDLNDKIKYYLSHPKERIEVIEAMQPIVRERLKWEDFYARVCVDMISEFQDERALAAPQQTV